MRGEAAKTSVFQIGKGHAAPQAWRSGPKQSKRVALLSANWGRQTRRPHYARCSLSIREFLESDPGAVTVAICLRAVGEALFEAELTIPEVP